ncbi:hypothetical protein UlMin_019772 [Ulmus minor]
MEWCTYVSLYVAVGSEPFLQTYNGSFLRTTYLALQNIQFSLIKVGLSNQVKVIVPLNADPYKSSTDIHDLMVAIVKFLSDNGGPFTVNIYPFITLYIVSNFPVEYAFFDGNPSPLVDGKATYSNMFDANYDTLVWALQSNGFENLPLIVGDIGWPTDGDMNANMNYAQRFNQGFMSHILGEKGTPMRTSPIDTYFIYPWNFECHWGIFTFDGRPKYQLNLGSTNSRTLVPTKNVEYLDKKWCVMRPNARLDDPQVSKRVSYACGLADCTNLGYGTSSGNLDAHGNISYAFNRNTEIVITKIYPKHLFIPISMFNNSCMGNYLTFIIQKQSTRFSLKEKRLTVGNYCEHMVNIKC